MPLLRLLFAICDCLSRCLLLVFCVLSPVLIPLVTNLYLGLDIGVPEMALILLSVAVCFCTLSMQYERILKEVKYIKLLLRELGFIRILEGVPMNQLPRADRDGAGSHDAPIQAPVVNEAVVVQEAFVNEAVVNESVVQEDFVNEAVSVDVKEPVKPVNLQPANVAAGGRDTQDRNSLEIKTDQQNAGLNLNPGNSRCNETVEASGLEHIIRKIDELVKRKSHGSRPESTASTQTGSSGSMFDKLDIIDYENMDTSLLNCSTDTVII